MLVSTNVVTFVFSIQVSAVYRCWMWLEWKWLFLGNCRSKECNNIISIFSLYKGFFKQYIMVYYVCCLWALVYYHIHFQYWILITYHFLNMQIFFFYCQTERLADAVLYFDNSLAAMFDHWMSTNTYFKCLCWNNLQRIYLEIKLISHLSVRQEMSKSNQKFLIQHLGNK